ncbi:hypothetical protein ACFP9V_24005 [Deinococcus radiopugnans]|uniref:Fe-S protein YdhL (DUF1289 family) n=1 Tax=Deinococcus radiopugnans ATCC 19172 TaxID=585398 RepID=A0A5C4XL30_9DEIO|nr:hypothetical protein [Deinococcus radiopugnans]MBB6018832.1 putative Fe-S protein YdhL (DUF1289 family) [Deinococcus radiopugnans ATCC 19172]QLG13592.1 hypothetical protein HLB42_21885 [Deinococcus sp. D7000]TNM63214.1 hypothetical protein FHR04_20200 [Deinococcus radiopugnans ATCC 19172]
MTDEQYQQAEVIRHLPCTADERRQVLDQMAQRRAVLLAQLVEINKELHDMEAIEMGHRAALNP